MLDRYQVFSTAVSCLYHDIQKIERMEMAKFGMKGPQAQCLLAMRSHPEGITASRLCQLCERDKAAISRTLAELEKTGMVRREERNGSKYRACLFLTEQGWKAAETVCTKARLAVEQAGDGLDDQSREVFYAALTRISENLHALCQSGIPAGEPEER